VIILSSKDISHNWAMTHNAPDLLISSFEDISPSRPLAGRPSQEMTSMKIQYSKFLVQFSRITMEHVLNERISPLDSSTMALISVEYVSVSISVT
jgi:hypothetical protein